MVLPVRCDSPVSVVVDSAASLSPEMAQRPRLHVVPMGLSFGETTYLDGRDLSPTDFYRILKESPVLPTTSAPSPASFLDAFRQAADEARSVLCLTVASRFSASYDSAKAAAREAKEMLPDLEVSVLETQSAAGGEGLIALEAWRTATLDADLDEVRSIAQKLIAQVRLLAFVDTLYYLWKGGRVPRIAHGGASLLRIKPLFELAQGQVRTVARPRTHRRAVRRLIEMMRLRVGSAPIHATVMHAASAEAAEDLRQQVEAEFPCQELFISEFTPVMGAHIGPGLLGIAFWSN